MQHGMANLTPNQNAPDLTNNQVGTPLNFNLLDNPNGFAASAGPVDHCLMTLEEAKIR